MTPPPPIHGSSPIPGPILSEAMADPTAVSDAQGEFLEIGNPNGDTLRLDSLRIEVDGHGLLLGPLEIAPGGLFLLCRDSVPAANGGMACDRGWGSLSLANGRTIAVALAWKGGRDGFLLPASRPGVSWENTWATDEGYHLMLPSASAWSGEDSATPGIRNSRSVRAPLRDLGIKDVTWRSGTAGSGGSGGSDAKDGVLLVRIDSPGALTPPPSTLTLRLDSDWDGEAETGLDSAVLEMPNTGDALLSFVAGAGMRGVVHVRLGRDEDPSNNLFLLMVEPVRPLAFTEWRPAPAPGEPEWVEIRNCTGDSGGKGRRLDLGRVAFNGVPLGSQAGALEPGEYLILTASLSGFRAQYGSIKVRVLQPAGWRSLNNGGGALELSLAGLVLDRAEYGAVSGTSPAAAGTPGFSERVIEEDGWSLSGKVAGPGRPLDVQVSTISGRSYALRVFDLEGNLVRDLGVGGGGRRTHAWDGRGKDGACLNPGPYIVCLTRNGAGPRRAAVIVMDSP